MVRAGRLAIVLVPILGCGEQASAFGTAELDELCGEAGPVQILESDPERFISTWWNTLVVDDRRIINVYYRGDDGENDEVQVWSVGRCGEDPILLHEGGGAWVYAPAWPDVLLVSDLDAATLSVVDPRGQHEPRELFEANLFAQFNPHGLIDAVPIDDDTAQVILRPWPDDPWAGPIDPVPLIDAVQMRYYPIWAYEDDAYSLSVDDELLHISLDEQSVEVVATNVVSYRVDVEPPYLTWRLESMDDPDSSTGPLFAQDRGTGETFQVTATAAGVGNAMTVAPGRNILWVSEPSGSGYEDVLYALPSLERVVVRGSVGLIVSPTGDGRIVVAENLLYPGPFSLLDAATGELTPLLDARGPVWYGDDAIAVPDGLGEKSGSDEKAREGVLKKAWYADARTEVQASRVSVDWERIDDGRVVSPVGIDEHDVGNLVLVDPDTLDELVIDTHIIGLEEDEVEDNTLIYAVPDGERAGIWMAKLAPK